MKRIHIFENGINVVFGINDDNEIRLLHFSAQQFDENDITSPDGDRGFRVVELQVSGEDRSGARHGNKYAETAPGTRMKYKAFSDTNNASGRRLDITCHDPETGLETVSHMQFYTGLPVVRCYTDVYNNGTEKRTIEYVSSFMLSGIEKEGLRTADEKLRIGVCHNAWQKEIQWRFYSLDEVGMGLAQRSSKVFDVTNTGSWSTKEYIPMGTLENTETGSLLAWQIEHNGSWHWEISDISGHMYLALSGPDELHSHWSKELEAGGHFESAACAVCAVNSGFDGAMAALTRYRRLIRRRNNDNKNLPVIFNDYMNCLWGDPTAEKEYPLIDAAAEAGCEYFVIDAGWYAAGQWWDTVGEWQESSERFPEGLRRVTDYIRQKGMIPGLWLEIESMGINCPIAKEMPDDMFFVRHGKRVCDRSRYQLDMRNPEVRKHCDAIIDRLVKDYAIGYIKMDYNIEPSFGTEINADSCGDGLLEHNRAYLGWLEGVFKRHKSLVIENCSSGGMRMDYAMLSRYSLQSTSDQEDYKLYASIAANAPSAVCPEQAAVWSFPMTGGSREEVVFNMVSAMLLRIHQSGHLADLPDESKALVKEGISVYKKIRGDIRESVPFWSVGQSNFTDSWSSLGLRCGKRSYVAVWHREGEDTCVLPISHLEGKPVRISCIYPSYNEFDYRYNSETGSLSVKFPEPYTARLFLLEEI